MKFKYKNILITGGCGFIGSNIGVFLKQRYPNINILALDNLTRWGTQFSLKRLKEQGINFLHGDIRNYEDLEKIKTIDLLIECSAEPSVLSGYGQSPRYIINTNLFGTVNCLELARRDKADIMFMSTSRVYPYDVINKLAIKEEKTRFVWNKLKEGIGLDFPLEGLRSMYGATKLASELIFKEYLAMYDLKGIINRCGVITGPWQLGKVDQGVFSLWMLGHYFNKPLAYIGFSGKGKQVRDLLHIDDFCRLLELQLVNLDKFTGQTYNVGGGNKVSLSLLETTDLCQKITGNKLKIIPNPANRPADLAIYITDNSKVRADFNWQPKKTKEETLEDIYRWIKDNEQLARSL